jgi:hypothetical protein
VTHDGSVGRQVPQADASGQLADDLPLWTRQGKQVAGGDGLIGLLTVQDSGGAVSEQALGQCSGG